MSDHLPFEIQTEIMKFLPIKSLIQFRSVSKQWNSLITSSQFIADYHVSNTQPPEHLFVSYIDQQSSFFEHLKYVSFVDDDTFPVNKFSLPVPLSVTKLVHNVNVIGSSHGLICLYDIYKNSTAVIWNPTITKTINIDLRIVYDSQYKTVIGFGVSPHTLDPKIVKVSFLHNDDDDDDNDEDEDFDDINSVSWQVEVYTISSGVWRSPLCNNLPRDTIQLTGSVVDINGFLYFMAYEWIVTNDDLIHSYLIISFDLKTEEFKEVNLPCSLAYGIGRQLVLSKFKESIAVFEFNIGDDQKVDVWMIENDVQRSVTKLFTINLQKAMLKFQFGFTKSGELLIEAETALEEHAELFVYEPNSKQMNYLGISGRSLSFVGSSYVETLLLLNH